MFIFMDHEIGSGGGEDREGTESLAGITWADLKQCAGTAKLCRSQILEGKSIAAAHIIYHI